MSSKTKLEHLLEDQILLWEEAIREAQVELESLRVRQKQLESLILRGRTALGDSATDTPSSVDIRSLHDAMEAVLLDRKNVWTSAVSLCEIINRRNLYRMRDGRPVDASQIHARARNYEHVFERKAGAMRLRYEFHTQQIASNGASEAALTRVLRASDSATMFVTVHVAYSVAPPGQETLDKYAIRASEQRAKQIVKEGGFTPDGEPRWRLTTLGWEDLGATT